MIQRIQTVYMLLAVVALVAYLFIPFGYGDVQTVAQAPYLASLTAGKYAAFYIPTILAAVLAFVAIFPYKKQPVQKSLNGIAMLLIGAVAILQIYVMMRPEFIVTSPEVTNVSLLWGGGGLLLIAALIALLVANNRISADQKLLRSYDRLR